jgi:glycine C-acetyltransferase
VRFICGTQALHLELEKRIAAFLGMRTRSCTRVLRRERRRVRAAARREDASSTDQLNHASIIDGVRLCKAKRFVYANADMGTSRRS